MSHTDIIESCVSLLGGEPGGLIPVESEPRDSLNDGDICSLTWARDPAYLLPSLSVLPVSCHLFNIFLPCWSAGSIEVSDSISLVHHCVFIAQCSASHRAGPLVNVCWMSKCWITDDTKSLERDLWESPSSFYICAMVIPRQYSIGVKCVDSASC